MFTGAGQTAHGYLARTQQKADNAKCYYTLRGRQSRKEKRLNDK